MEPDQFLHGQIEKAIEVERKRILETLKPYCGHNITCCEVTGDAPYGCTCGYEVIAEPMFEEAPTPLTNHN